MIPLYVADPSAGRIKRAAWSAMWFVDVLRGNARSGGRHRFAGGRCLCGATVAQFDYLLAVCPIRWGLR